MDVHLGFYTVKRHTMLRNRPPEKAILSKAASEEKKEIEHQYFLKRKRNKTKSLPALLTGSKVPPAVPLYSLFILK